MPLPWESVQLTKPRPFRAGPVVFLAAVGAHLWVLGLPFQLDDYFLLPDPLRHFGHARNFLAEEGLPAFMLRWPLWMLWAAIEPLAGKPLSPVPYHLVGLFLHGLTALLVGRAVHRFASVRGSKGAGLVAGLAFGLAGGHMQAVSWISAWSSLLYTLFGLAAWECFQTARWKEKQHVPWALGVLLLYLALVTKASAIVVPAVLALLLLATARGQRSLEPEIRPTQGPRVGIELALLAATVLLGFASRWLWFGSPGFRYYARPAPDIAESIAALPSGFRALAQGLAPWNQDPLLADIPPLFAAALGNTPLAGWLPLGWLLTGILVIFATCPQARAAFAALALALVPAVFPAGVAYAGQATNVVSRTLYLPMVIVAALIALAIVAGMQREQRRWLTLLWSGLLFLFWVDGLAHVSATETRAADEQRAAFALFEELAENAPGERSFYVIEPPSGLGDIPVLGDLLSLALSPPFQASRDYSLATFGSPDELLRHWSPLRDAERTVILLGPELDVHGNVAPVDPEGTALQNRERRRLRALSPWLENIAPAVISLQRESKPGEVRWILPEPLPLTSFHGLELTSALPLRGSLSLHCEDGLHPSSPLDVSLPEGRHPLRPVDSLASLFGDPLVALSWQGDPVPELSLLPRAVELEALSPPPAAVLPIDPAEPPLFQIAPTDLGSSDCEVLLELIFVDLGGSLALEATGQLERSPEAHAFRPTSLRLGQLELPWATLIAGHLTPELERRSQTRARFHWRLSLRYPFGPRIASTPLGEAALQLPRTP